jgi:Zn-dependent peptidase ImmA (M78 family)
MEDDIRVKPLRNSEIRSHAKRLRTFFGLRDARYVDVIACLKSKTIWTLRGEKSLVFRVRSDAEMGSADAKTTHGEAVVTIESKQSVYDGAMLGVGRPRNTFAHEFGHAVLHDGVEMPRLGGGNMTPAWMKAYESSEHQVKVFAPAFLINDDAAETLQSANDVSIEFGVSLESAEIYYEGLVELREREETAKKIRQLAEELAESSGSTESKIDYLGEPCARCGKRAVFPVLNMFMCQSCDNITGPFQDGDPGG